MTRRTIETRDKLNAAAGVIRRRAGLGGLAMALAAWLALGAMPAVAEEGQPEPLPQGNQGIAAQFPGDVGIEQHEAVVFAELFDVDNLAALEPRWDVVADARLASLSEDVPEGSASRHSLLITHTGGQGTGTTMYRRLLPGYEKLHYRFYMKLDEDAGPLHHTWRTGGHIDEPRVPIQRAGTRPAGDERFLVGVGPHYGGGRWDFYTYWMEMRGSPPEGRTWGNNLLRGFQPPERVNNQWVCVEIMIKINDVGESNGELAMWIDGELVGHLGPGFPRGKWQWDSFRAGEGGAAVRWDDERGGRVDFTVPEGGEPFEGFRFRTTEDLKINFLWGPMVYITRAEEGHVSRIWHDHVVVATEYIGPITPAE